MGSLKRMFSDIRCTSRRARETSGKGGTLLKREVGVMKTLSEREGGRVSGYTGKQVLHKPWNHQKRNFKISEHYWNMSFG